MKLKTQAIKLSLHVKLNVILLFTISFQDTLEEVEVDAEIGCNGTISFDHDPVIQVEIHTCSFLLTICWILLVGVATPRRALRQVPPSPPP